MTSASEPVGIGIVGCGTAWTEGYGPALARLQAGRLVGLCDSDQRRLRAAAARFPGLPTFTDLEKMLESCPGLEALVVSTPVFLHHDHVLLAARAGKHILCERPMARTVRECDDMDRACHQNTVKLMLGMASRFDRGLRRAAELIESGQLGRLLQVRCEAAWPAFAPLGWRDTRRTWGGLFQDGGSHTVDWACWWAGTVTTVAASVGIWLDGRQVEDQAVVTLEHESGAVSLHHLTRLTHLPPRDVIQIDGSRATLVLSRPADAGSSAAFQVQLYRHGQATDVTPEPLPPAADDPPAVASHRAQLEHFCQCIREDLAPEVGAAQGRHVVEVINAAYVSAAFGQKAALPLTEQPNLEQLFRDLLPRHPKIKAAE